MPKKKENNLTQEEIQLLSQAQSIVETINTPGWKYILSFMGESVVYPDPKTYHSREEVIIPYSESYGQTELLKKTLSYVNSREEVAKSLKEKQTSDVVLPNWSI